MEMLLRHIQEYSGPYVTLAYSKPYHIPNLSRYIQMLEYSEPFLDCIPTHTQNLIIFEKIGKPCVTLVVQNIGMLTVPEYSET